MAIMTAKNFTFTYPAAEESTLHNISFEMGAGEAIGIIGPVGAGKTTLCRAIAGLVPSITGGETSGNLDLQAQPHSSGNGNSHQNSRGRIGMVFEDYAAQLIQLQVLDEVKVPLINIGASDQEATERAHQLLEQVGLGAIADRRRVWELSGGQQQRLAIAANLALEPQILILDNVMDKLDTEGQEKVHNLVAELNGQTTQVVVDRDVELLLQKTQRLLVLVEGQVIAEGPTAEILRNPDLLARADIKLPLSLRLAQALNLPGAPLTLEEFEQVIVKDGPAAIAANPQGQTDTFQERAFQQASSSPTVMRDLRSQSHLFTHGQVSPTSEDLSGQPLVSVEGLTHAYGNQGPQVLKHVNLTIQPGEVHALMGHSGAGKTTLIKHIAGLVTPREGRVTVCGTDVSASSVPELALTVGTVMQNPDEQLSEQTVRNEIAFPLKHRQHRGWFDRQKRYDDGWIESRVAEVCELVGIEPDLLEADPILLPRGQRKLVTIATALVVDPSVLLLDEPTIGLGATSMNKIHQTLTTLKQQGKAVLLVSNHVDWLVEIADRITVLQQGNVMLQDPVGEAFAPENWDRLPQLSIKLPQTAQLARRLGRTALTFDQLVAQLSSPRRNS